MAKVRAKTLTCPSCGAALPVRNVFKAKLVVCRACDSQIDLTKPGFEALAKLPRREPPQDALCLGLKGQLEDGRTHEIIGRIRFEESDADESWFWDEWLLLVQDGTYLWLSEEGRSYELHTEFVPENPPDLATLSSAHAIPMDGTTYRVKERGRARIGYVEGELTWRATVGDRVSYVDTVGAGGGWGVEYSDEEIEFFKRRRLSRTELYLQTGLGSLVELEHERDALRIAYQKGPKARATGAAFFTMAALAALVLFVLGSAFGSTVLDGSRKELSASELGLGVDLASVELEAGTAYDLSFDATAKPALSNGKLALVEPDGKSHTLLEVSNLQKTGGVDFDVDFRAEKAGRHVLKFYGTGNPVVTTAPAPTAITTTTTPSTQALTSLRWKVATHPIQTWGFLLIAPFLVVGALLLFIGSAGGMASASARAAREYREMRQAKIDQLHHELLIQD